MENALLWEGKGSFEIWNDTAKIKDRVKLIKTFLKKLENEKEGKYYFRLICFDSTKFNIAEGAISSLFTHNPYLLNQAKWSEPVFLKFFDNNPDLFEKTSAIITDFPSETFIQRIVEYNRDKKQVFSLSFSS